MQGGDHTPLRSNIYEVFCVLTLNLQRDEEVRSRQSLLIESWDSAKSSKPQPHPGRPQLSRDAGRVRGATGGEIQLSHQRGKCLRQQLLGLYGSSLRGCSEHVGCNRISAVQLWRPPAHRGREYSPTSPTSSQSTSAGWSGHMTPPLAPSPTTQSSSTSTRVLTPWSISSTTPSWTCKWEWRHVTSAGLLSATALLPPLRSSSSIAVTDKNGSFISTLSMSLFQVPASSRARHYTAAWFTCNSCHDSFLPGYILHQAPRHTTAGHRTENKRLRPGGRVQLDVLVRTINSIYFRPGPADIKLLMFCIFQ